MITYLQRTGALCMQRARLEFASWSHVTSKCAL